jgi:hypothetical protein
MSRRPTRSQTTETHHPWPSRGPQEWRASRKTTRRQLRLQIRRLRRLLRFYLVKLALVPTGTSSGPWPATIALTKNTWHTEWPVGPARDSNSIWSGLLLVLYSFSCWA